MRSPREVAIPVTSDEDEANPQSGNPQAGNPHAGNPHASRPDTNVEDRPEGRVEEFPVD
jgi:hypothetical protein